MTAIIWKEIREHLKWAVLWLLAMGVAVAVILYNERAQSVCSGSFLGVLAFGGALGGTLLALAQILPEMRRGQWAFLVHRPATPTSIFLGKVIGGLLLYFAAMGLPQLAATIWAATPGTLGAPFEARMVLPGLANILAGVLFYFAGLLTGLRSVRWYGSRALPLVAALPCLALVAIVPEFWMALLVIVIGGVVLAFAAWGSFLTAGAYASQPRRAKVALGVVLLGGVAVACLVLVLIAAEAKPSTGTSWTHYAIDAQGDILTITEEYGAIAKVAGLNGTEPPEYRDAKAQTALRQHLLPTAYLLPDWYPSGGYQNIERYFVPIHAPSDFAWYYVCDAGYIRGYSRKDRYYIGSIGPDGFAAAGTPPGRPFPGPLVLSPWSNLGLMAFAQAVYRVDLPTQRVHTLYQAPSGQEVLSAVYFRGGTDPAAASGLAIATRQEILFLEPDGTLRFKVPHPCDIERYGRVQVAATAGGEQTFVWYSPTADWQTMHGWVLPDFLIKLAADGSETRRYALPVTTPAPPGEPAWRQALSAVAIPVLAVIGVHGVAALTSGRGWPPNTLPPGFMAEGSSGEWISALCANVIAPLAPAAICAVLCLLLARRYVFGKGACIGWTIGGLLLGPLGTLTLLALRDWPARETCPACGKLRVVDRDECERCGAPFPAPVPDGTEIFDC